MNISEIPQDIRGVRSVQGACPTTTEIGSTLGMKTLKGPGHIDAASVLRTLDDVERNPRHPMAAPERLRGWLAHREERAALATLWHLHGRGLLDVQVAAEGLVIALRRANQHGETWNPLLDAWVRVGAWPDRPMETEVGRRAAELFGGSVLVGPRERLNGARAAIGEIEQAGVVDRLATAFHSGPWLDTLAEATPIVTAELIDRAGSERALRAIVGHRGLGMRLWDRVVAVEQARRAGLDADARGRRRLTVLVGLAGAEERGERVGDAARHWRRFDHPVGPPRSQEAGPRRGR